MTKYGHECSFEATYTLQRRLLKANVWLRHIESTCRWKHPIDTSAPNSKCILQPCSIQFKHFQLVVQSPFMTQISKTGTQDSMKHLWSTTFIQLLHWGNELHSSPQIFTFEKFNCDNRPANITTSHFFPSNSSIQKKKWNLKNNTWPVIFFTSDFLTAKSWLCE